LGRIRTAILNARTRGIRSQIDGDSTAASQPPGKKKPVRIYDAVAELPLENQRAPGFYEIHSSFVSTRPLAILLRRPPRPDGSESLPESKQTLVLLVDAAGKVWSAKLQEGSDKELTEAARGWKFIPAFQGGKPVACRFRLDVSPDR
jgi:hypothetical protein